MMLERSSREWSSNDLISTGGFSSPNDLDRIFGSENRETPIVFCE